jgi:hypothetical protein
VYRVDRLARSVRGLAHILDELDRAKVAFRSATEPFDTATAAGRMMVQMLDVFAEFERAAIVDRIVAGANGAATARRRHLKACSNASEYLLAGVLTCARCGHRYVGGAAHGRSARYRYYRCFTRQRYGADQCDADFLPADALEEAVIESLSAT